MKLNVKAAAITLALIWGLGLLFMTWWLLLWEGPDPEPNFLSKFYLGYRVTWSGSFIGLVWALLDGFVGGAALAWLYNQFAGNGGSR